MDSTSSFSEVQHTFPDAELLQVGGSTCECYRVKLYGKLHFLKRLKPQLRTHPQYVAALQKEFETGYSLDHPHLVRTPTVFCSSCSASLAICTAIRLYTLT